ncbi:hypothetical protein GJ496_012034 [Pomphorhynchus laevis]|nr:hypothetical protein GJ496_012034 [Pomphorhynchus laevis]
MNGHFKLGRILQGSIQSRLQQSSIRKLNITDEQIAKEYKQQILNYPAIGQREIVGTSTKLEVCYFDESTEPFPPVKWERDTAEMRKLQEKEKGDWKLLTIEDKRTLYHGETKFAIGVSAIALGVGLWLALFLRKRIYVYNELPVRDDEYLKNILIRMIQQRQERITGVGSKWDYERGTWKWVKHAPRLRDFPEYES